MTGFNLESHFADTHIIRCKSGYVPPCVSDSELQKRIDSGYYDSPFNRPIVQDGPMPGVWGVREEPWHAAYSVRQREDFADAAMYIAVVVAAATVLYYLRPIWHGVRQAAARFRAWLNAYDA